MYLTEGPVTSGMISGIIESNGKETGLGGHSIFLGQVRSDLVEGKRVAAIEYSAYDEMVTTEVEKIQKLILLEFDDAKSINIIHSRGVVKAGEISLFVMVSAGHRQHALKACEKTVELIKERLPVWKKEIFEDNTGRWRQNK